MNSNGLKHYYRHPGLTKSTEENILRKLEENVSPAIKGLETEICYNLDLICDFTPEETEVLLVYLCFLFYRLCDFCSVKVLISKASVLKPF